MVIDGQAIPIEPFEIAVDDKVLVDLRERIRRTRRPMGSQSGWDTGPDPEYLRSLLSTWADEYDWREREHALNGLPQYRAQIDSTWIHFVHARGNGPDPLPLVLTHGWPSSFLEHLEILPLLTDPADHGGNEEDAFDVVVTSLPGFAFSEPLAGPMLEESVADVWHRLMTDGLGYRRYGAHGSDAGSGVTIQLGLRHPESLAGIHLSAFYVDYPPEPWPEAVRTYVEGMRPISTEDRAYSQIQRTRPGTLAVGLADSPAGLAAWMVDVFRSFSDCDGDVESRFSREQLLTNLTLYWASGTIGTSMRGYYDVTHAAPQVSGPRHVDVPSGFAVFADSYRPASPRPPRELVEQSFNVTRWTDMARGGHFAALEEPELLVEDIREFFRPLR